MNFPHKLPGGHRNPICALGECGDPMYTQWDDPWHDVLQHWNVRAWGFGRGYIDARSPTNWEGRVAVLKQRGETPGNCNIMRDGVVCRKMGGQDAEQVVGAGGGTEQEQEPCCLQAVKGGHALQQAVLLFAFQVELPGYEGVVSEGGPEHLEPLALRGEGPVGDVGWFLAGSIPDPGLALVQPDTRMGPKRGDEGIVEHPDAFWRGDDVNVVEERKDGLSILELSVQVVQGGVLGIA
eukprot:s391_g13.t1